MGDENGTPRYGGNVPCEAARLAQGKIPEEAAAELEGFLKYIKHKYGL